MTFYENYIGREMIILSSLLFLKALSQRSNTLHELKILPLFQNKFFKFSKFFRICVIRVPKFFDFEMKIGRHLSNCADIQKILRKLRETLKIFEFFLIFPSMNFLWNLAEALVRLLLWRGL